MSLTNTIEKVDALIGTLEKDLHLSPNQPTSHTTSNFTPTVIVEEHSPTPNKEEPKTEQSKPKQNHKKQANEQPKKDTNRSKDTDAFEHCHIQISKITSIKNHPEAEKLFVCDIETGSGTKQLCAGLVGFYKAEDLNGKLVVTIMNLKPRKMRGVESAAMVLAGDMNNVVSILTPPPGSNVGDRVFLKGGSVSEPAKILKSELWDGVVHELKVMGGNAMYKDKVLVTSQGDITVPNLPDEAGIH